MNNKSPLAHLILICTPLTLCTAFAHGNEGPSINWTAVVEVEANHTDTYEDESESDLVVATAFLGAEAQVNESVSATITLLYEEDDTPVEVDEAFVTQSFAKVNITGGQIFVPFGQYATSVINDPLTLEIGETRETAILVETADIGIFSGSAYIFNGDKDKGSDDTLQNFGIRLGLGSESDNNSWSLSVDYISNIADSDGFSDTDYTQSDNIAGTSIAGSLAIGNFGFSAEIISTDDFDVADLAFEGSGAELSIAHVDVSMNTQIAGHDTTFGLSYNLTDEAVDLELPESRISLAMIMALSDNTAFSVEFFTDDDYDSDEGGTGESSNTLLLQFAAEI